MNIASLMVELFEGNLLVETPGGFFAEISPQSN